ncbi:hypothetical protein [Noviherbaspirillum malthae]|jgi:hypothetical protein|uniref:hypothetical protein n=1 Tax=Noviherbaspirillum malthae TaxID=1260987 RepID=UPI00188F0350|nr:hypothetical protein [Noviherbaspirillum malthae]
MKIKARNEQHDQLYTPKDGQRYIVILHDGRKVEGQWSVAASGFYLDETQSIFVLQKEAFDWWPASV